MTSKIKYRQQYDDDADAIARAKTDIENNDISLTEQSHKDSTDINIMVKQMGIRDHELPTPPYDPKHYGDFSDVMDFREALDKVQEAQEHFRLLSAEIRQRFNNNPIELYKFVGDSRNDDEAVRMGLLKKIPEPPAPEEKNKETPK